LRFLPKLRNKTEYSKENGTKDSVGAKIYGEMMTKNEKKFVSLWNLQGEMRDKEIMDG
jgi:hypothetical protein